MARGGLQGAHPCQLDLFDLLEEPLGCESGEKPASPVAAIVPFDAVVSNPPYQADTRGTRSEQLYPHFMDLAYAVADVAAFVTPARFLFDAGNTPKAWNKRMLADEHLRVVAHFMRSIDVFSDADVKAGVAVTLHDMHATYEPVGYFIPEPLLRSAVAKVRSCAGFRPLQDIVYSAQSYRVNALFHRENPTASGRMSHQKLLASNITETLSELFHVERPDDGHEYIRIWCRIRRERTYRWFRRDYLEYQENLDAWKVFVPASNGSGAIGEVASTPIIGHPSVGQPLVGHTQTFMTVGCFATEGEAQACMSYIKTKFARAMLGSRKRTQHNSPDTWANVPLQDFGSDSDIDWSLPIAELDRLLYARYGLSKEEREFIEGHVSDLP